MFWDRKKSVIFHAGIGKTGTSAFQHALFKLRKKLEEQGMFFPVDHLSPKIINNSQLGKINSGNLIGPIWKNKTPLESAKKIEEIINNTPDHFQDIIFSNEGFFKRINQSQELRDMLYNINKDYSVRFLFCIRDVVEHLTSSYIQSVKRHRQTKDFNKFLSESGFIDGGLTNLVETIKHLEQLGIDFKVINYSSQRRKITEKLFEESGANMSILSEFDQQKIVNRSLSYAELTCMLAINRIASKHNSSNFSADISLISLLNLWKTSSDHPLQHRNSKWRRLTKQTINQSNS